MSRDVSAVAVPANAWENLIVEGNGQIDYQVQLRQVSDGPNKALVFTAVKLINGQVYNFFNEHFQLQVNGHCQPKVPVGERDYVIFRPSSELNFERIEELGIKFDKPINPFVQFNVALLNRDVKRSHVNVNPIVRANGHHWTWVPIPGSTRHDPARDPSRASFNFGFEEPSEG